jgi:hypothetical protein
MGGGLVNSIATISAGESTADRIVGIHWTAKSSVIGGETGERAR